MFRELTNEDRADFGHFVISYYEDIVRGDREDSLCDLLSDLMHWADREGFDFDAELARGKMHHEAEVWEAAYVPLFEDGEGVTHEL